MKQKYAPFHFIEQFEDFITLGGGHLTAAICTCSPPILFDPGVSVYGPRCLEQLRTDTGSLRGLIIALSHSHFDHCGAAAYLKRRIPSARIAASSKAAEILTRPNAVGLIRRLSADYEQQMKTELSGEDVSFSPLTVTDPLEDGDCLELDGGRICRVIATPGHTRDSLSFFFPDTGIAFAGDAAGAWENGFVHSPFLVSYEDYMASIEKLIALQPAAICIPHSGIVTGPDAARYLACARDAAREYKDWIAAYLERYDGNQEKVVERITAEEYDTQADHIQKRQPFILNLRAKVKAAAACINQ